VERLQEEFDAIDTNGDGLIQPGEWAAATGPHEPSTEERAEEMRSTEEWRQLRKNRIGRRQPDWDDDAQVLTPREQRKVLELSQAQQRRDAQRKAAERDRRRAAARAKAKAAEKEPFARKLHSDDEAVAVQDTVLNQDSTSALDRLHDYIRERMATVLSLFRELDKDGSGSIDAKEFAKAMKRVGAPVSPHEALGVLRQLDEDGDGKLQYRELVHRLKELRQQAQQGAPEPSRAPSMGEITERLMAEQQASEGRHRGARLPRSFDVQFDDIEGSAQQDEAERVKASRQQRRARVEYMRSAERGRSTSSSQVTYL